VFLLVVEELNRIVSIAPTEAMMRAMTRNIAAKMVEIDLFSLIIFVSF
jgi:hypothetical protein